MRIIYLSISASRISLKWVRDPQPGEIGEMNCLAGTKQWEYCISPNSSSDLLDIVKGVGISSYSSDMIMFSKINCQLTAGISKTDNKCVSYCTLKKAKEININDGWT